MFKTSNFDTITIVIVLEGRGIKIMKNKKKVIASVVLASAITLSTTGIELANGIQVGNTAQAAQAVVDTKYVKYGHVEVVGLKSEQPFISLRYNTFYKWNHFGTYRNGSFEFTLDPKLAPYVTEVIGPKGLKATVNEATHSFSFQADSLVRFALIGVPQEFTVNVQLNQPVGALPVDNYRVSARQLLANGDIVARTQSNAYMNVTNELTSMYQSKLIRQASLFVDAQPENTKVDTKYELVFLLNALSLKNSQVNISFEPTLLDYVTSIEVSKNGRNWTKITYNEQGKASYPANELVSYSYIGLPQDFFVRYNLKNEVQALPDDLYTFNVTIQHPNGGIVTTSNTTGYFLVEGNNVETRE